MCDRNLLGPLLAYSANLAKERLDTRLAPYDVTPSQIRVLHFLYHHNNQAPQCEVTAYLKVKPSTANGILDRMEEKGLLQRSISEADARRRLITLTEKGIREEDMLRRKFDETEDLMTRGLSEAEADLLYSLLQRVISNLEEDRDVC